MSQTIALHGGETDDILKSLHKQFTINDQTLFKITTTFLSEISDGLSNYGRAMAMMHVFPAFFSYTRI
jgi:hexokinase